MDVAKYIGLFLLKNEQCYINGLGTLQLLRKASQYDGKNLHAAHNEVTIVPGGNVDDSLANFIATNQMISISKASDRLKEYSAETKAALQEGKEVVVPFIGSFALRDNRIIFLTDPLLLHKPANIPAERGASLQHNERPSDGKQPFVLPTAPPNPAVAMPGTQPPPPPQPDAMPQGGQHMHEEKTKLNWWRIIFVLLFLVIMAGAAYYAYQRFLAPQKRTPKTLSIPEMNDRRSNDDDDDNRREKEATQIDSTSSIPAETQEEERKDEKEPIQTEERQPEQKQPVTAERKEEQQKPKTTPRPQPKVEQKDMIAFKAVINTYDSKEEAYARARQLRKYGSAEVIEEDTNYYFVAIPINTTKDRKKRVIDSLTNRYNQDGVFVY